MALIELRFFITTQHAASLQKGSRKPAQSTRRAAAFNYRVALIEPRFFITPRRVATVFEK
ncbi:MAG: hypothetical protein AL399_07915 [Candidatus [Bacteroides] periocalifornicus]|uniref:Uncharacterized protein n=1 Tax=Candidatus [Bacteroides] periocalifornicus TaxID=1702214 RepID=A0A0Q4B5P6_9BACT|nr:MAG: hypothetical protein AL399_07915 [Candidatus [Bacteroides] periocalifornicus]